MKKLQKTLFVFSVLFLFCMTGAIAKNRRTTQEVDNNITNVILKCNATLHISQGTTNSLKIEARDKSTLEKIDVTEDGKDLFIDKKEGFWDNFLFFGIGGGDHVTFYLTIKTLESVKNDGSANIIFDGPIKVSDFQIKSSGSGEIAMADATVSHMNCKIDGSGQLKTKTINAENEVSLNSKGSGSINIKALSAKKVNIVSHGSGSIKIEQLKTEAIDTTLSGNGDISLAGVTNDQAIALHGSAEYGAKHLKSDTATIKIMGSGGAIISVNKAIAIKKSGSGSLDIYGNPTIKQIRDESSDIKFHESD